MWSVLLIIPLTVGHEETKVLLDDVVKRVEERQYLEAVVSWVARDKLRCSKCKDGAPLFRQSSKRKAYSDANTMKSPESDPGNSNYSMLAFLPYLEYFADAVHITPSPPLSLALFCRPPLCPYCKHLMKDLFSPFSPQAKTLTADNRADIKLMVKEKLNANAPLRGVALHKAIRVISNSITGGPIKKTPVSHTKTREFLKWAIAERSLRAVHYVSFRGSVLTTSLALESLNNISALRLRPRVSISSRMKGSGRRMANQWSRRYPCEWGRCGMSTSGLAQQGAEMLGCPHVPGQQAS